MPDAEHPLTCHEAVARLDDFMDRQLGSEQVARVEAHLAECLHCAARFRFEADVLESIRRRVRRISLPPDLAIRVHAALDDARTALPEPGTA